MAFLTLFLSRAELIKQNLATGVDMTDLPSPDEMQQWSVASNLASS